MGPAAVPVSVVRAVRDAGSARQSGPLRICILVLGCRRSSISTHVSSVSHVSQSSRGTWSSRCMQRRRHTLRTTPTHRHTTHNGRLSRTIGHRAANNSPHRWGGRQNPTHTGAAQTPYTSALARCGRRSPLGPISPFQRRRAATRRAEPVSAGDLGAARDAGMRDGSVGSVPKADRLGCELRQPPFLYPLDHVQAVGGRAGWPRAGGGEGVRR